MWYCRTACSPDLASCDQFLWGHLKNKVYVIKSRGSEKKIKQWMFPENDPQSNEKS